MNKKTNFYFCNADCSNVAAIRRRSVPTSHDSREERTESFYGDTPVGGVIRRRWDVTRFCACVIISDGV